MLSDIQAAVIDHYQKTHPTALVRDNMVFFPKEGVILSLNAEQILVLSDCASPHFDTLIKAGLAKEPKNTMDKMNQRRAWRYLVQRSLCRYFDYCDPRLFDLIDEILHVQQPLPPVP